MTNKSRKIGNLESMQAVREGDDCLYVTSVKRKARRVKFFAFNAELLGVSLLFLYNRFQSELALPADSNKFPLSIGVSPWCVGRVLPRF